MKKTAILFSAIALAALPLRAEEEKEPGRAFSVEGEVEVKADAYYKQVDPRSETNNQSNDTQWLHDYSSTFNLNFSVKFNEKWSAEAAISADDDNAAPGFAYDGAFAAYTASDNLSVKIGDMTYAEGAFLYYDYDDTGDYAIGMMDHKIRGAELNYGGFTVAAGLGRDDDDCGDSEADSTDTRGCTTYDTHAAYTFTFGAQRVRPYVNYKSYQTKNANALRAGVVADLAFGEALKIQAVYALFSDGLKKDSPKMSHIFAVEPELSLSRFSAKATAFYALLDDDDPTAIDAPEYMFAYIEPGFAVTDQFHIGLPVEYHTMTLDDDADLAQVFIGPKAYLDATERLSFEAYARAFIPVGDDYKDMKADDPYYGAGAKVNFTF